jgi:hypothetical protein
MLSELTVARDTVDLAAYRGKPVTATGLRELPPDTLVRTRDGEVLLAYLQLWKPADPLARRLREALANVRVARTFRASSGSWQNSAYFGAQPRQGGTTHDYCRAGELDKQSPAATAVLYQVAAELERRYWQLAPATYAHHAAQAERIRAAWRPAGLRVFTGGVVNRDNPITWHRDRGNFAHTWSAMPVVRAGMAGGALAVPELGLVLPCDDGTAVFFDGQSLIHGVTPMRRTARGGHRHSVVFYAVQRLWQCLEPGDEIGRMQASRTEREYRRATGGGPLMDAGQRQRLGRP